MMKHYLSIVFFFFAITLQAQEEQTRSWVLKGCHFDIGFGFGNYADMDMGIGATAGFGADLTTPWSETLLIMPEFQLERRNCSSSSSYSNGSYKEDLSFLYCNIPIRVGSLTNVSGIRIIPYIGPYFSVAVSGSADRELNTSLSSKTTKQTDDLFGKNSTFSRFDMGCVIGAKVAVYQNWYVQGEYMKGLKNINSTWSNNNDKSSKWGLFRLTIGTAGVFRL